MVLHFCLFALCYRSVSLFLKMILYLKKRRMLKLHYQRFTFFLCFVHTQTCLVVLLAILNCSNMY